MKLRWFILFLLLFAFVSYRVVRRDSNRPPQDGDAAEVHNIAYSLAHGRGYSFDWNDERWRSLWQDQNAGGRFDFILVRRGAYPTMFRPPLMPILVAGILEVFPRDSFRAWRIFDSAAFAVAACLLSDVAFVQGGTAGMVAILLILVGDPLRRAYLPGWGTEGLAFVFVSLIAWLVANSGRFRPAWYNLTAGFAVGLLCLDRSIFVLAMPCICLVLAIARTKTRAGIVKDGLLILVVATSVQMPWWVRNITVSGRLMPLGTQGGVSLPDEYGDVALDTGGEWTGRGIRDAWIPPSQANRPIPIPPGFSEESFQKLWTANPGDDASDHRFDAMLYAAVCTSLESEIEVSAAGQRAAVAWVRANYAKVPGLMARKAFALTFSKRRYLAVALLLGVIGFLGFPKLRRTISCLALLIASYVLAVALTHVVYNRFLLPILPPLYLGTAWGISAIARLARRRICALFSPI
ncbi:MAG: hypothetical protein ABSH50_02035 [Bryobacteraceae bacterium]|jgi:hypothetical protein